MTRRVVMTVLLLVAALAGFVLLYGPGYLTRADRPTHADAVVVFVGPGGEHRFEEGRRLVAEGYARYLIIPAYGTVSRYAGNGRFEPLIAEPRRSVPLFRRAPAPGFGKHLENTHIEALLAKQTLDRLGMHSAILVSSPFHTRRIGLISSRVFGDGYAITLVPSRFQKPFSVHDWFVRGHLLKIAKEYVKMVWFLLYQPFGR